MTELSANFIELANQNELLLTEIPYQSIQGEGVWVGQPMIFVRLQGCNVGCNWCDSYYTWSPFNKTKIPATIYETMTPKYVEYGKLIQYIRSAGRANHIWITGGEPLLQAKSLAKFLKYAQGMGKFHICTAGTLFDLDLSVLIDYITVDVKAPTSRAKTSSIVLDSYARMKPKLEFKIVVANNDADRKFALEFANTWNDIPITLQPLYYSETDLDQNRFLKPDTVATWNELREFADWVNTTFDNRHNVRLGLQLHKHLYPKEKRGI